MGLLNFKQLSDAEAALLFSKHRNTPIKLTPQEKLDAILRKLGNKNISVRKYHFKLIEGETMLHLYTGTKDFLKEFEKSNEGIKDAREFSKSIFFEVKKEFRQGGYKFDLVVDGRQIDLSMGFSFQ